MSKIVPKSMQSQSSPDIKTNQYRKESAGIDVMFSVLFGGATGETSSENSLIGTAAMTTTMSADSGEGHSLDEQTSDASRILMASLYGGRRPGEKITRPQDEALNDELGPEKDLTTLDSENSEALALVMNSSLFPENQNETTTMPRSGMARPANMIFEDGAGLKGEMGSAATNVVSKAPAGLDGNDLLGQNKASTKLFGPQQAQQNSDKFGENLVVNIENTATKNITSDLAKLQALRAANLEQKNADIDEEAAKTDLGELKGKLGKNGFTGAGLKQMMVSTANTLLNVKVPSLGEGGRTANEVTRLAAGSSSALESAPAITGTIANGSSSGQSGAHTGHQGSAQSGSQSGGGLLGNLTNLQILDTAKDNWTEMLLQRVKNGLSGGKDQLDFQLNPRNLGKMRISLLMQNDRTHIRIQTETSAAASMLNDSESRLAQMLEASGLRLGNLNSGQFQGFGGAGSDRQANQQSQSKTGSLNQSDDVQGEVVDEMVTEGSDNLINIQA